MKIVLALVLTSVAFFAGFFINQGSVCQAAGLPSATVSPSAFSQQMTGCNSIILDVRTAEEFNSGHLAGAINADYNQTDNFSAYLDTLDKNKTYFIYCRTGNRSGKATQLMADKGFASVINLDGGIVAWQSAGLPVRK